MIHVIGPDGKTFGPFANLDEARDFGVAQWPTLRSEDREENPNAWEIQVSTRD